VENKFPPKLSKPLKHKKYVLVVCFLLAAKVLFVRKSEKLSQYFQNQI